MGQKGLKQTRRHATTKQIGAREKVHKSTTRSRTSQRKLGTTRKIRFALDKERPRPTTPAEFRNVIINSISEHIYLRMILDQRNKMNTFKLGCQMAVLYNYSGLGPVMKVLGKHRRRATLNSSDCIEITTELEAEMQETMRVEWTKVTIFTPDCDNEDIKVEDLYLTILIRTTEPEQASSKIKEICGVMHLIDTNWPLPHGVKFWTGPSENLNMNFLTQLTPIE